jgi:hypothetical protein
MWTLAYSGIEKALGDWGLCADFAVEFVNKGRDSVTMRSTEGFDAAAPAQFAWGAAVTVWRDRTPPGGAGGFTGGTMFFQGYVGDTKRLNVQGRQNIQYAFYGPWWLLERLQFMQGRSVFNGWATPGLPSSGATLKTLNTPEVFLGEKADETWQTNGQQIVEILSWVNECYNPTKRGATSGRDDSQDVIRIGAIDPAVIFPKTRANDIFCAEGLVSVLRWSPDVVCWFDYTTSPPTFNARAQANLRAVTATVTAEQQRQVELAPRYERQLAGVVIEYKQTNVFNGFAWPQYYYDIYPSGITDYTPNCSRHFVELAGSQVSKVNVVVEVIPVGLAVSATPSDRLGWWQSVDMTLNDPNIDPASIVIDVATVTDGSGDPVDLTQYPNTLVKGQLSTWMGVQWTDVTVMANASFNRYADAAHKVPNGTVTARQISHRVTLTNAISQTYRTTTFFDPGESVPVGVAQAVYNSLATLQYSGSIAFVAGQVQSGIAVGDNLTLAGPTNTYANLLVQSVRAVPHLGLLSVAYAPSARLDAPELIELARCCRWRTIYNLPSGRSTGQAAGCADVGLGSATAKENTQYGVPAYAFQAATFDQGTTEGNPNGVTQIAIDAQHEQITICRLDAAGSVVTADGSGAPVGQIGMKLSNAEGTVLRVGRVHYTDAQSGAANRCWMLRAPGVVDAADGNNGADDLWLGGGAPANAVEMTLKGVQGDYVTGWPTAPLAVASLTSVLATGQTATPHGITVGRTAQAVIAGATPSGYNGTFAITSTGANTFTYPLAGALAAATGTITATIGGARYTLSSLTSALSTIATVTTSAPHGLPVGTTLSAAIAGAAPAAYNGTFTATITGPTTFTYTFGGGSSPAAGTITYQADVYVAKPWKLRTSRTTETGAGGTVYALTYGAGADANNVQRTKTPAGGTAELEAAAPEWLVGDVFYAVPGLTSVLDANGNAIRFFLAGESRNWTAVAS